MACSYKMKDAAGAWQTITGKPAMMAALADGRLDHLLPAGVLKAMATPAAAPKPAAAPRPAPAPAPNTIFTEDAAAKARELLRRKLGQLNSGLDPEMLQAGITLAGYHIEKGARSFAAYAEAMLADLGDAVRPYLKSWYMGVKYDPRAAGFEGMDTAATVEAADENEIGSTGQQETQESAGDTLRDLLYRAIKANNMPKDNLALRKIVQEADGAPPSPARMKEAQEDLEAAIVMVSRDVVAKKEGDRTTFDILLRLYESQPNLNIRTSTSIDNQAYSTPAPLAFLTARLAGIGKDTTMYEPTAGNGMLAITAEPRNVTATELDGQRFGNLQALGVNVTQGDALKVEVPPKSVDAVHTNPPFGPIKNEKGESIKVKFDGYTLGQIDHLIAARALEAMKDDGQASLIIGANKVQGQMSNNDLIFFNWLYGNYNVTTHFEVSGDLYQRQGAGWPVRVITINGRAKSDQTAPAPGTISRASNWSEVYEQFQKGMDSGRGAAGSRNGAIGGGVREADNARAVSTSAGAEAGQPDSGRPAGRPQRTGNVAGAGARVVGDRGAVPDGPVGQRDRGQRPDDGAAGADGRAGAAGAAGAPAKPAGSPRATGVKAEENQFQSIYVARSARKDEGVLIPVNMAGPTQDALNRLEDEVGDIDEFVAKELGYPSIDALHDAFMGLQVDSIASAVYQIKAGKGIIIADQTGIGKGRQAAGIIRWAAKNGKIPVFVTVKPSLFTDMYGDLADIGTSDVAPFILNSNAWIKGPGDEKLFANRATLHKAATERIATTGELPSGRNALFLTYSQINTDNVQRRAVMALAPNAVFVLDESHNAGGDSGTGAFVRDTLGLAAGVTYLSATYAKRPDNMPVYFKTDIGDASADDDSLMAAMSAGGLPLQTVVANNLVKAGQMFRRERSYDGVSIESRADTAHRAEHVELSDSTTLALRAIVKADATFHANYVKALQKELEKQGARVMDMAGNQAKASVDHTQFSSVVHNFVRQMLLGLKAQESADEAIRSLRRGEKPLIAVENTMGSFLAEYAENNNLKLGDSLGAFDYRTVLSRALERSRYIIRQLPNGDKVKEYIPLNKLDPISRAAYESAQDVIDELEINIPVSPIDWMRNEITKAGFSVAEVTGRNLSVDYSNPSNPKLAQIDPAEQKDKVRTTRLFNSGQLDALVLNVAGSTGISLHASEKFKDQRQRHMIVAQAAQDINIFMQMLGRIHRTGQVRLPKYTILTADLPAEIRPTALLSGKMKSLNANTSSNTKSATSVESADMLNKYGDQVVGQYLADNPELARALGVDGTDDDEGPGEDIARKATGRLALMPVKVQEQFYAEVEEQYRALIDYLNKTNQNDLEPRTFDLDARELKSELLFEGRNKASPFGEDAFYNEFSIKAQGKAMTPDEIRAAMAENLGGLASDNHAQALVASLKQAWVDGIENAKDDNGLGDVFDEAKFRSSLEAKKVSDGYIEAMVAANRDAYARGEKRRPMTVADVPGFGEIANKGMDFVRSHPIGSMFRVEINGDNYNAVVTNIRSTHKASGNPFSLSKFQVTIALNGALRSLTVPATQFAKIETSRLYGHSANIDALFRPGPTNERETAKIITGNLLGAYGEISESRGSIITFTKADGSTEQGILMPKAFNFAKDVRNDYRLKTPDDVLKFLTNSKSENIRKFGISSRDGIVRVLPEGARGIAIQVPKSKAKGGRFFLDTRLREHAGDFVSVGNSMFAYVEDAAKARMALDVLMQKQALYALPSMSEEARAIIGDAKPAATIAPQSKPSAPAAPAASSAIVEHTTQNGKVLRGIVRTDLTRAEAQKIDPYTFSKEGGFFIRERHLKDEGQGPSFSRTSDPAVTGITYDTLPAAFAKRFPKLAGAIKTMLHRGALGQKGGLVVLDSNDSADIAREFASRTGWDYRETMEMFESVDGAGVHAIYDPKTGTTFAIGPNLDEASLPSVILHEAYHGQQRQNIDAKAMALIQGRAKEAPALRAFLDRVAARMEQVGEADNRFEAAPYIVEMAVMEGRKAGFSAADGPILAWIEKNIGRKVADLVRGFVATLRAWALAHGLPLKSVAVDDLVAYAMAGVGRAARGNVVTLGDAGAVASMSGDDRPLRAGWSEGRIDRLISEFAYDFDGKRTKAYAAFVKPDDFLNATTPKIERNKLEAEAMPLDRDGLASETQPIYLQVRETDEEDVFKIVGHEGRHRMMALRDAGYDRVPVVLILPDAVNDAETIDEPYFTAQKFGDGTKAAKGFDVRSATPITSGNRAELVEEFSARANGAGDIRFSRSATLRAATQAATSALNDTLTAPGKLSWWHKTVGTMYNLAERSPAFAPVFKAAQGFIDDVSHYANDAAEMAPKLLPKLDAWRDIWKSPISAADNVAIAKPVFEGTLLWGRDAAGRAVKVAELSEAAEKMSIRQKADRLMGTDAISSNVHKMWLGLPVDQYEKNITTSYEGAFLQPGIVWKDAELRSMFGLNDKQVELYREFRRATDRSLDTMARADMLRYGGRDAKPIRDAVMDAPDVEAAAIMLRDHFGELAKLDPERETMLLDTANAMMDRADKVLKLQKQGYAPLSRFGRYTVDVVVDGERQYFGLYETAREANRAAGLMRQEFGAGAVTQGTLSNEAFKMFAGITPETLELFGNALGLDSTGDEARDKAFQEYLRLTKSNRSAMKRMIHRQGIAGYSEDVARVLASFVYSNARQTAAGLHMGDLGEAVQKIPKEEGELKDVAFRLADYVKNPQEEAQAIRGLLFAQYLGGSIASAFVNMTQPAAVTFPWLSQFGGAKAAAAQLAKAAADMAKKRYEPALAKALRAAEEDGTVSPQEVHQLMAQAQGGGALRIGDGTKAGDALAQASNGFKRMAFAWGKVFSMAEQVNRRMTFIAAYRTAQAQGMPHPEQFARKAVQETQFVYSKASKQQWGRGAVGGTLMTFKTYSIAYLELLHRMATQGGPEGKKAALLALGMLMLMGGAGGLPFASDAEDIAEALARMLGYNISVKKARQELLEDAFGRDIAGFIDKGITGLPGVPLDISGRLGMGNLIPGTGLLQPKTDHTSDVLEILGPAGDLAKRAFDAGGRLLRGDITGAALQASPVAARNLAKGADMATTGMYRDAKGYKVLDTDTLEAALKAVGFQPKSVATIQEANAEAQQAKNFYSLRAQEIRMKWAQGIFEGDQGKVQEAREAIADWNEKNPDQRMIITVPSVLKKVREMRKPKDERIAATAPKAMRASLREELGKVREGL